MTVREEILTQIPFELMMKLSLPAILGMVVIGLYPLMDGIFAGRIIGEAALTACGIAVPLLMINSGIATLIGVGSASVLSRALGREDYKTVDLIMGNLLFWSVITSLIITIVGISVSSYFLDMIGATGIIKEYGIRYLRVLFIGSLFANFSQCSNMVMRGEGLIRRAMIIMAGGAIFNIVFDPIFMLNMGEYAIEGAAIATVLAEILQAIFTLHYFMKKSEIVQIKSFLPDTEITKEMFSVGVSAMLMSLLFMVRQIFLYKAAFQYGGDMHGILMSAVLRVYGFAFIPLWGMSQGLQPIVGTNYGAGKMERVRKVMYTFLGASTLLAAVFWLPIMIFPKEILLIFGVSESLASVGVHYSRIFFAAYALNGIMITGMTYFQSIGDGKSATWFVVADQLLLFIPLVLVLPLYIGIEGVWSASSIVDFSVISISLIFILSSLKKLKA